MAHRQRQWQCRQFLAIAYLTATLAVPATYSAINQVLDAQYALHNSFILDSGSTVRVCNNIIIIIIIIINSYAYLQLQ
jgi:hypothetical protein